MNEKEIYDLATCSFVRKKENIVFIGQTGTGKTLVVKHLLGELEKVSAEKQQDLQENLGK